MQLLFPARNKGVFDKQRQRSLTKQDIGTETQLVKTKGKDLIILGRSKLKVTENTSLGRMALRHN